MPRFAATRTAMRMKRIRSILPLGYYIKAKREEVAAESEREPITAQPEDKQQDKPEDKSQDKERRKHPGRQTLPAHLELVEHVRLAIRGARCRVDPRCRAKAQHGYDLSNTLISSARVSASKPLPTSTLRPLVNKTARRCAAYQLLPKPTLRPVPPLSAGSPQSWYLHSTAARQTASSDAGPACSTPFHDCDKTRFVPSALPVQSSQPRHLLAATTTNSNSRLFCHRKSPLQITRCL